MQAAALRSRACAAFSQPLPAPPAPWGRISLTVGAFFLALFAAAEHAVFVVTVAVMFWFAFSYLTLKPREALAAYRG